jgi:hypothetical protein
MDFHFIFKTKVQPLPYKYILLLRIRSIHAYRAGGGHARPAAFVRALDSTNAAHAQYYRNLYRIGRIWFAPVILLKQSLSFYPFLYLSPSIAGFENPDENFRF